MSNDCIFCKIAKGEIPSNTLYEDDEIIAFEDVSPQAPVHFLVIPKKHIPTFDDINTDDSGVLGKMLVQASVLARDKGVASDGYRQIINCRDNGGQVVHHLHLHIMGGRKMGKMG